MKYSKVIINSILLLTTPSLMARPQLELHEIDAQEVQDTRVQSIQLNESHFASYDDILRLLEKIEAGCIDNTCTSRDLERINHFIAHLARQGALPNEFDEMLDLENDIEDLLYGEFHDAEWSYSCDIGNDRVIVPLIFQGHGDSVLCKSWIKKKWSKVRKFVKKHKTAILIGAAVVVAATVVVCAVAAATAGVAAGAAAAASESKDTPKQHDNEKSSTESNPSVDEHPNLQAALDEHISSFKEMVVEENLLQSSSTNVDEKVRELGAFLAHETLEGIRHLTTIVPNLSEEIKEVGSQFFPDAILTSVEGLQTEASIKENLENLAIAGHQKIDQVFSTDQAEYYTSGAKKISEDRFAVGIIPLPGSLAGGAITGSGRIPATQASTVIGWKEGESIRNLTSSGNVPKWTTVRRRYWKNQAYHQPEKYEAHDLERMKKGLAPQRLNDKTGQMESKELHHSPPQKEGGLFDFIELWPDEHAEIDPNRYLGW